jgi:hypothetical protein
MLMMRKVLFRNEAIKDIERNQIQIHTAIMELQETSRKELINTTAFQEDISLIKAELHRVKSLIQLVITLECHNQYIIY